MTKLFYITAGIFTLNAIFNLATGEVYTGVQLGFATLVLWMWAYLLETAEKDDKTNQKEVKKE